MRLTITHANFWLYHRGPKCLPRPPRAPSIHDVINQHVAQWPDKGYRQKSVEPGNLRSIVRMALKREPAAVVLMRLITSPYPCPDKAKRTYYARRWFRRLTKGR